MEIIFPLIRTNLLDYFSVQTEPVLDELRKDLETGKGTMVESLQEATNMVLNDGK